MLILFVCLFSFLFDRLMQWKEKKATLEAEYSDFIEDQREKEGR